MKGMENSGQLRRFDCVQYKNKGLERITNKFAWDKMSDKIRVIFERNNYDGQCHRDQPVWKSKHDNKQTKQYIPMNLMNNTGSKMVDEVG